MTNFWVLISIIAAGILGWTDLKSDNRVRDMVVGEHTDQIISVTAKVSTVDMKLSETRELLIKISGQMDSLVKEQAHQGRQIDRLSPAPHGS